MKKLILIMGLISAVLTISVAISDVFNITNNPSDSINGNAVIDSSGYIHVVWQDNATGSYQIYYEKLEGGNSPSIENAMVISNSSGNAIKPAIAIDGNVIHVVWQDNRDGNWEIYYAKFTANGIMLESNYRITNTATDSINPDISARNGTVFIAWTEEGVTPHIYYRIYRPLNTPPSPDFYFTSILPVNETAYFFDNSTDDGIIINYTWQFGDGGIAYGRNVSHVYTNPGRYYVTLTVMDEYGAIGSRTKAMDVIKGATVSKDYNESTPGWNVARFSSIQAAIDNASDGDTIKVYPGLYRENIVIDKPLKLIDDPVEYKNAVIDAHGGIGINVTASNVLIENCTIFNGTIGILVHNDSFTIQNVTINNCKIYECSDSGIYLQDVNGSLISNCIIHNNSVWGIVIERSTNNTVFNNSVFNHAMEWNSAGIVIFTNSHDNLVINNTVYDNGIDNIEMWDNSNSNIIRNNTVHGAEYGMLLSKNCENNEIDNNTIYENTYGIGLGHGEAWGGSANNNFIRNNEIYDNDYGIYIFTSSGNTILNCEIYSNAFTGLYAEYCDGINITGNNISLNGENPNWDEGGIYFSHTNNSIIEGNYFTSDIGGALVLWNSHNNTISNNDMIENCGNICGMALADHSSNNSIDGNNILNNTGPGIWIDGGANNNTILNNTIKGNPTGIYLSPSTYSNLIYNNYFENPNNANDYGNNIWNISKIAGTNIIGGPWLGGNYWSDYDGYDTNGDGLGDTMLPYNAGGNIQHGGDMIPLVARVHNLNNGRWYYSIQAAIDNASDGETIKVYPGIYHENVVINKEIKLIGDPAIDAHGGIGINITANNTLVENFTIFNGTTGILVHNDSFTIRNITINNCRVYNMYLTPTPPHRYGYSIKFDDVVDSIINGTQVNDTIFGIDFWRSPNNTITNCTVYSTFYSGIYIPSSLSSGLTITNCIVHNSTYFGIELVSSHNTIKNCTLYSNGWDGITLFPSSYTNISNCTIYSNGRYGISFYNPSNNDIISNCTIYSNLQSGIWHSSSDNTTITHCSIYDNTRDGIYLSYSENVTISKCTIHDNDFGIWLEEASNNTIFNNVIYNHTTKWNSVGIILSYQSNRNNISSNTVYNNGIDNIEIWNNSLYNIIWNNTVYNATYGILASRNANNNTIAKNEIYNTTYGIGLGHGNATWGGVADNATVIWNDIDADYGIYVVNSSGFYIANNTILHGDSGIYWLVCNAPGKNIYDGIFENNEINGGNNGIEIWMNVEAGDNSSIVIGNITIAKNEIHYCNNGIYIQYHNISAYGNSTISIGIAAIHGNVVDKCTNGIFVRGGNTTNDSNAIVMIQEARIRNNSISNCGGEDSGIHVEAMDGSIIENNTLYNCSFGIALLYSSGNIVRNNSISDTIAGIACGIALYHANDSIFSHNSIYNYTMVAGNAYGIAMVYSSGNTFDNISMHKLDYAAQNDFGLFMMNSENNTFANLEIYDMHANAAYGIFMTNSSNNSFNLAYIHDINATVAYAFYADENSSNNVANNVTIASYPTTISFKYGNGIALKGVNESLPSNEGFVSINKFLNITNVTTVSWINLTINYDENNLGDVNESTLALYEWNGSKWNEIPSHLYQERNCINANITAFSIYGVFGKVPINVTYSLHAGWNLITVPVAVHWHAYDLAKYINGKAGYTICDTIVMFDSLHQRHIGWVISTPNYNNFSIEPGVAYWIYLHNDITIKLRGIMPTINISLHKGFNAIGWVNLTKGNASMVMDAINNSTMVISWNESKWDYDVYAPPNIGINFNLILGEGFYVYCEKESTWRQ